MKAGVENAPARRDLRHLIPWAAALILFAICLRFLRILALDLETLIVNLYQVNELSIDWVSRGRLALQLTGAPLIVLALARLSYRVTHRWLGLTFPLAALRPKQRWMLAAPVVSLFTVFCVPFSLGGAVWIAVEIFWWIEWYVTIPDTISAVLTYGSPVLAAATWLLGLRVAALTFRGQVPREPGRGALAAGKRWAVRLGTALVMLVLLPLALVMGLHGSKVALAPGLGVFEGTCGRCHFRTRPLYFAKTPLEWERTVKRMKGHEKAPINDAEMAQVLGFLKGMRSYSDSWTFRTRCQRCHHTSYLKWEDRRPEDWDNLVERMGRYSHYYHRKDIRVQLKRHLGAAHADPWATLGLTAAQYKAFKGVEKVCAPCHSLSLAADRYSEAEADEVAAMVERMNQKMPTQLTATQLRKVTADYKDLIADPRQLKRLLPHDRPIIEDEDVQRQTLVPGMPRRGHPQGDPSEKPDDPEEPDAPDEESPEGRPARRGSRN